jgi:hypothetical protein
MRKFILLLLCTAFVYGQLDQGQIIANVNDAGGGAVANARFPLRTSRPAFDVS